MQIYEKIASMYLLFGKFVPFNKKLCGFIVVKDF